MSPRVGLLAHEFRRSDLPRFPQPSSTRSSSDSQRGPLLTYSGGTAPVLHRTSLLCPYGHPRYYSIIQKSSYPKHKDLVNRIIDRQIFDSHQPNEQNTCCGEGIFPFPEPRPRSKIRQPCNSLVWSKIAGARSDSRQATMPLVLFSHVAQEAFTWIKE